MRKKLYLVRGLPGSGKSTLAEIIAWGENALNTHEVQSISTDDSFIHLSGAWKQMVDLIMDNGSDIRAHDRYKAFQKSAMVSEGVYTFIPEFLPYAHAVAKNRVQDAMLDDDDYNTIIVHNTFSQPWEANVYKSLAEQNGYEVFVVECQNRFANTHNVPQQTINSMQSRWLPLS